MRRLMLTGVAIAVLATGCKGNIHLGSEPTSTGSPSTATPAPSATSTDPTTTTSTPPSSAPHSTPSAAPTSSSGTTSGTPACYSMGLHASLDGYDAGAGQRYVRLILTNLTEHACTIGGWASLDLLASGNSSLGSNTTRTGSAATIVIPAGGHAHSQLHWTVVPAGDETGDPCEPTATMLQVTAPGETTPLFTTWGGGVVCQHFQIDESALTAGTGA
jgi:Protein of unknown function (DUF4232)